MKFLKPASVAAPTTRSPFTAEYRNAVGRGFAVGVTERVLRTVSQGSTTPTRR